MSVLYAIAIAIALLLLWRLARQRDDRRDRLEAARHGAAQDEFTRAIQAARSEGEAQRLLEREVERSVRRSAATLLALDDRGIRLEAVNPDSPLAAGAATTACAAVRLGERFERGPGEIPVLGCELCGALPGAVTCLPSVVGGEAIGSVLLESRAEPSDRERRRLAAAVALAAPVLANLRNLRLADARAATDALTGLANRRGAEETLRRMLAHARRLATPCAVAILDLDHFRRINDTYGHDAGDQLLVGVAKAITSQLRASDFVARFGGEEFLVVLPDTDLAGGMLALEKVRSAIAGLRLSCGPQHATASFGVAVFPEDGAEPDGLICGAERALHDAKRSGRDRVRTLRAVELVSSADDD